MCAGVLFCAPSYVCVGVSERECWCAQVAIISVDTKTQHTHARHSREIKLLEARQALQQRRQSLSALRPKQVAATVHGTREQSVTLTHSTHIASQVPPFPPAAPLVSTCRQPSSRPEKPAPPRTRAKHHSLVCVRAEPRPQAAPRRVCVCIYIYIYLRASACVRSGVCVHAREHVCVSVCWCMCA